MSLFVCNGAKLKCSMGSQESDLGVIPTGHVPTYIEDQLMATQMDNKPFVNIKPFGQCQSMLNPLVAAATAANYGRLQKMPCLPNIAAPWMGAKMNVKFDSGVEQPLLEGSTLLCTWAGNIEITDPGQDFVVEGETSLSSPSGSVASEKKAENVAVTVGNAEESEEEEGNNEDPNLLTVKDFAETLINIEKNISYENALHYAAYQICYNKITKLARKYVDETDEEKKEKEKDNDPNLMPSRFMILYGADDAKLREQGNLDKYRYDFSTPSEHDMSVANLREALIRLGYEVDESDPFDNALYFEFLKYLGRFKRVENGIVEDKEDPDGTLDEVAEKYGVSTWKYFYDNNSDKEDKIVIRHLDIVDKLDRSHGNRIINDKEKNEQSYHYISSVCYHYPWVPFSMTVETPDKYEESENAIYEIFDRKNYTLLHNGDFRKPYKIECLLPDSDDILIFADGMQLLLNPKHPIIPECSDVKIVRMYWTYGSDQKEIRRTHVSRYLADLRLHVKTQNAEDGEEVRVLLETEYNAFGNNKSEIILRGPVKDNQITFCNFFEGHEPKVYCESMTAVSEDRSLRAPVEAKRGFFWEDLLKAYKDNCCDESYTDLASHISAIRLSVAMNKSGMMAEALNGLNETSDRKIIRVSENHGDNGLKNKIIIRDVPTLKEWLLDGRRLGMPTYEFTHYRGGWESGKNLRTGAFIDDDGARRPQSNINLEEYMLKAWLNCGLVIMIGLPQRRGGRRVGDLFAGAHLVALWDGRKLIGDYKSENWLYDDDREYSISYWKLDENVFDRLKDNYPSPHESKLYNTVGELSASRVSLAVADISDVLEGADENGAITVYEDHPIEQLRRKKIINDVGMLKKELEEAWGSADDTFLCIQRVTEIQSNTKVYEHWRSTPSDYVVRYKYVVPYRFVHSRGGVQLPIPLNIVRDRLGNETVPKRIGGAGTVISNHTNSDRGSLDLYVHYLKSARGFGNRKGIVVMTGDGTGCAAIWNGQRLIGGYDLKEWFMNMSSNVDISFWELLSIRDTALSHNVTCMVGEKEVYANVCMDVKDDGTLNYDVALSGIGKSGQNICQCFTGTAKPMNDEANENKANEKALKLISGEMGAAFDVMMYDFDNLLDMHSEKIFEELKDGIKVSGTSKNADPIIKGGSEIGRIDYAISAAAKALSFYSDIRDIYSTDQEVKELVKQGRNAEADFKIILQSAEILLTSIPGIDLVAGFVIPFVFPFLEEKGVGLIEEHYDSIPYTIPNENFVQPGITPSWWMKFISPTAALGGW